MIIISHNTTIFRDRRVADLDSGVCEARVTEVQVLQFVICATHASYVMARRNISNHMHGYMIYIHIYIYIYIHICKHITKPIVAILRCYSHEHFGTRSGQVHGHLPRAVAAVSLFIMASGLGLYVEWDGSQARVAYYVLPILPFLLALYIGRIYV